MPPGMTTVVTLEGEAKANYLARGPHQDLGADGKVLMAEQPGGTANYDKLIELFYDPAKPTSKPRISPAPHPGAGPIPEIMRTVIRVYDTILYAMAAMLAAATLIWLMVSIVVSVAMRNAGDAALRLALHLGRIRASLHDHARRAVARARAGACAYRAGHGRPAARFAPDREPGHRAGSASSSR